MRSENLRRLAWGVAGLLSFLWIGYEDRGTAAVRLVAGSICLAAGLQLLARWRSDPPATQLGWLLRTSASGLAVGAAAGPVAALLMLIKLSLHTHPIPDFSPEQVLQVLRSTPQLAGEGAALGLALGGLWLLRRRAEEAG